MKSCFIFDVREVTDRGQQQACAGRVLETVRAHGGRYLEVGGACHALEGGWRPNFLVLLEFPDHARARAWYDSAQCRELARLRQAGTRTDGIVMEPRESDLRRSLVNAD